MDDIIFAASTALLPHERLQHKRFVHYRGRNVEACCGCHGVVCGMCAATSVPVRGLRTTIDAAPKTAPALTASYDFDLLDAVEGAACVGPTDVDVNYASIAGFEPTAGDLLSQRAESAALYDTMSKAVTADTILVTWVKIVSQNGRKCATVHARGVRLKKAGGESVAPGPTATSVPAPSTAPGATPAQ